MYPRLKVINLKMLYLRSYRIYLRAYLLTLVCILSVFTVIYLSYNSFYHEIPVDKIQNDKTTITATEISAYKGRQACKPYVLPDPRPFFEREPIPPNLPRRLENLSDDELYRKLSSLKLLVFSTARNVEASVDIFRKHIDPIVDLFHSSSRILICESDSDDKTLEKLQQWSRAQVYSFSHLSQTYSMRTERIAFCRNRLMNLTYEIESDYILHVDLDVFRTDVSSFISNFRYHTDDWAAMTVTSNDVYYDIWALRTLSDSILNFDVWHRVWAIEGNGTFCSDSVVEQLIRNHQKHIPIERGLIEVRSAFNGGGLYRTKMTYGCQYSGADTTCEHVSFHLCIRDKHQGRIFINPEFILDTPE